MPQKNKLVIVGTGETAAIAMEIATSQALYEVCGFSVDAANMNSDWHRGLPVAPLHDITHRFPAEEFTLFIAISFIWLNQPRARIFQELREQGYRFGNIISPLASIAPSATLGTNLLVYDFASVGTHCGIADNTTLCSHSVVSHSSQIGAHNYLAAGVITGGYCRTGERCFLGLNATLSDNGSLGDDSILSAASYLPKGVHASGLYVGNPAKKQDIDMNDFLRLKGGKL